MGNPADLISQNEKREVLRNDRLVRTTYHSVAQAFIDEDRGDRFSVLEKTTVTGSSPIGRYPKLPSGPWSEGPGGGPEPSLGYSINEIEPVGEPHERERAVERNTALGEVGSVGAERGRFRRRI
jgi:hypothetical protein